MEASCYRNYKFDYVSRGSYGHVFKVMNDGKKNAIKLQLLDSDRTLTILIEMAILIQISQLNKNTLKHNINEYNPFMCNVEDCLLFRNSRVLNEELSKYLQVSIQNLYVF